ncbi:peptidase S9 [Pseudoalteromonas sp. MSK9-3]|uniref:alpha/beta hydrolase family protein n=1 Tax=Pseudoalteromonas sp. MSK9-3 TaxID=1897633 RepID=UPI000E6BBA4A|nr:S9 family peptidase [Pseudoalteromonas sp. MSK9-3]RJE71282.1 peptidase S9 [Pseudoalteromonas sp. MSK9-3]
MQLFLRICFIALLMNSFVSVGANNTIPVEHFSKDLAYSQIKISPGGEFLAFVSKVEGKKNLYILDLKSYKIISGISFTGNGQVGDYVWANNERIVVEKQYLRGWSAHPEYRGELMAMNSDGSHQRYLVGYLGEMQTGSAIRKSTPLRGTSYILDSLPDDSNHILVVTYPWRIVKEPKTVVYRVNIHSGIRKRVAGSPSKMGRYLTDHQGNVRIVISTDDYIHQSIHIREKRGEKWKPLPLQNTTLQDVTPWSFDKSGKHAFIAASESGGPKGIYKLNLATGATEKVFQDNEVSPTNVWVDDFTKEVFAIELEAGYPSYAFVDSQSRNSKKLKSLLATFPNSQVHLVSTSKDNKRSIAFVWSDKNPGQYYLYDENKGKLTFLFAQRGWILADQMSETKPIKFKARDGITLHGYLTLPKGKEAKNLPLVVMPHGGPHGPRDYWRFDADSQLLASRGIAVLKVNFRGSGGYGRKFEVAGYRQWGNAIQHDIIDATRYVIQSGYADEKNMCIMGASFGGYSALQSAIIEPELFKCAVGVVGVYDLPLMFKEGDVADHKSGRNYLSQVLGTDQQELSAFSPSYNIDKLKAPVLIVHGGEDERAPIEQAESLIKSLKAAEHSYKYMLLESEGHGFYQEKHRTEYYKTVLAFLDEHLKL